MNKIYRLKDDLGMFPYLNYRYEKKDMVIHKKNGIKSDGVGFKSLSTEHEIIMNWAKVCKEALTAYFKESDMVCWDGHYEQFGMVMLNLAKLCRNRLTLDNKWYPDLDGIFPEKNLHDIILSGYGGTEDRIFYRAWLSLLGHPSFVGQSLIGMENTQYKMAEYRLLFSFNDLNRQLLANRET